VVERAGKEKNVEKIAKMIFNKIKELKDKGLKIGITFSQFDLLHAGHVAMLAEAKNHCDYLIAGLQNNAAWDRPHKNQPIQSIVERQITLSANRFVDEIVVYNTEKDLEDILLTLPLDVRILGVEYMHTEFTGRAICEKRGIELVFNSRDHSFSSTNLRERVWEAENTKRYKDE
jgi:glycerol-3-phosphate cytidylyltransferase